MIVGFVVAALLVVLVTIAGASTGGGVPVPILVVIGILTLFLARKRWVPAFLRFPPVRALSATRHWVGKRLARSFQPVVRWRQEHRVRVDATLHGAFQVFFFVLTSLALLWLAVGIVPALAHANESWHAEFHADGRGTGLLAEFARNIGHASHSAETLPQVALDYAFSILNIGLGIFLVHRGPRQPVARLLAVALIGTAVAFNLQGHWTLQVIPVSWLDSVDIWHSLLHVLAGVCYVFALLLFPDGQFVARRRVPALLLIALVVALLSTATTDDHVGGLLWVFGLFIPIAALSSQIRRFRNSSGEKRQQSKILLIAMSVALVLGVAVVVVSSVITSARPALATTTRNYEVRTPEPGSYYFRCDPHPSDMFGTVIVDDSVTTPSGSTPVVEISAEDSEFDTATLTLPANRDVVIRFTNKDGDGHNISIYELEPGARDQEITERSGDLSKPVFLGDLFAGQDFLIGTFRGFRIVFALIPIAIFVGILRFRLWDIDHLVNRAMVYGTMTGGLLVFYFFTTLFLGTFFRRFLGLRGDDVLITLTTLGAAALFSPARRTVQEFIDRRFYRHRYNAATTLQDYAGELRNEVDVDALKRGLLTTIDEAMQPAHVSLLLLPRAGRHRER